MIHLLRLLWVCECPQIPVIYYDSTDDGVDAASVTPLQQLHSSPFHSSTHRQLERSDEFDVKTPESLDLPMADMDIGNSLENLSPPLLPSGYKGTVV